MNKAILIGNVGKKPEIHKFDNGTVATFSLATNKTYKNKAGEKVTETTWHNIKFWGKTAEIVEKYVNVGDKLSIIGEIQNRSYEKDGDTKYITEINGSELEMLTPKSEKKDTEKKQKPATALDDIEDPFNDVPPPDVDDLY